MTSRGRPAIGERVELRIPPPLLARVDAEAARLGVSRAEAIRQTIERGLG